MRILFVFRRWLARRKGKHNTIQVGDYVRIWNWISGVEEGRVIRIINEDMISLEFRSGAAVHSFAIHKWNVLP